MSFYYIIGAIILIGGAVSAFFFRKGGIYNPTTVEEDFTEPSDIPLEAPKQPQDTSTDGGEIITPLLWDTVQNARHSVRVICDQEGLTWADKNDLCATVGAESGWMSYYLSGPKKGQPVIRQNIENGKVWSTDFGISQINDHFHIGPGKSFPSSQYVLDNPEACIRWMCKQWKLGNRNWWIAYKHGAYKAYL